MHATVAPPASSEHMQPGKNLLTHAQVGSVAQAQGSGLHACQVQSGRRCRICPVVPQRQNCEPDQQIGPASEKS